MLREKLLRNTKLMTDFLQPRIVRLSSSRAIDCSEDNCGTLEDFQPRFLQELRLLTSFAAVNRCH